MTFDKFWEKLCEKQPGLKDPEGSSVTISVASFQKQLRQAFKAGVKDQKETDALARQFDNIGKIHQPFGSFVDLFG